MEQATESQTSRLLEHVRTLSLISSPLTSYLNLCPHHKPGERVTSDPEKQFLVKTSFLRATVCCLSSAQGKGKAEGGPEAELEVPLEPQDAQRRTSGRRAKRAGVHLQGGKPGGVERGVALVISLQLSLLPHPKGATDTTLHRSRRMKRSEVALKSGGRWSKKNVLRDGLR